MEGLANSIKHFTSARGNGAECFRLAAPIVINSANHRLIDGHQRVKALELLGQEFVHIDDVFTVNMEPDGIEERALNVALENPAVQGTFTEGVVGLVAEIENLLPDVYQSLNFDTLAESLVLIFRDPPTAEEVQEVGDPASETKTMQCPECGYRWET